MVVAMLLLAFSSVASAAKGGGAAGGKPSHGGGGTTGGTGSIGLVVLNSPDGLAHWGGLVTFNVATTATTQPWVHLVCSQNGAVVSEMWNGFFDGSLTTRDFGLYSPKWTGGAADCVAYLTTPQWAVLGSTSFHVSA